MGKKQILSAVIPATAFCAGILLASLMGFTLEKEPVVIAQTENSKRQAEAGCDIAEQLSEAFEAATEKANPSVVPIFAEQVVTVTSPFGLPNDPFREFFGEEFFKRFFGTPRSQEEEKRTIRGLGSGVIVTDDGYILTNNHVVESAEKLTVVLTDEKRYSAKVIGTDPQSDVAVIKIDAKGLSAARLGNSDDVKVGQWVIAVGNPFQLLHTVTAGIISAKGRSSVGLADYEDFIQTDASINPGNSGGALADLTGNVIGINTAISSPSGGNVGIGFAIPINMARRIMDDLVSKGKVSRGYLALLPQAIDENLAKALKLKSNDGALVGDVTPGGPADKGGIKRGDVIVEFNGKKVKNDVELRMLVAQNEPGKMVDVKIIRDGKERTLSVRLGERPRERTGEQQEERPEQGSMEKLGLSIQNLTPDLASQLGYENQEGALVADVGGGTPAEEAGLRRGDLIQEVDRQVVRNAGDLQRLLARVRSGDSAALLVRRGQNTFFVAIQIT